ncbi:type II toxin-antitoxin system YafQ family toxin [Rhodocaloribacter litoris]|uniref:hypothetical protein n=1 Tax=Rhodocaloribacter litoris TaxID=2558931 RepID=UPI00142178D6|nr:hypothetical protein [Rhodocaloribacter litoris]QXD16593.1 type II toxin-antitoxin system YafQ family toxin [Rhodocaloribacter litoris]
MGVALSLAGSNHEVNGEKRGGFAAYCLTSVMKVIRRTNQFKKEVRRAKKRGKDVQKLKEVIEKLARGETRYSVGPYY